MNDITEFQKKIYENLKKRAFSFEGVVSEELLEFRENLNFFSRRKFNGIDESSFLSLVDKSQLIFLGDFHTFDQSIKNLVRLMNRIESGDIAIALEMIESKHQEILDSYLANHITELEFLEAINYSESWRFPWNHYKLIFDSAKNNNIEILALNSSGSLDAREEFAADKINQWKSSNRSKKLLVLFGELHLAPNKLPQKVISKKLFDSHLIIHQNLDEVYWNKKTNEEYLRFNDNEVCLVSSPPWMKYESMIYWFEGLMDDCEFELHEYIISSGVKIFSENQADQFKEVSIKLSELLNTDYIENEVNLYDHSALDFLKDKLEKSQFYSYYLNCFLNNESFVSLDSNDIYCANYSYNELIKLSGFNLCFEKITGSSGFTPDPPSLNLIYVFSHIYSYICCKLLNPYIKCDLYQDLVNKFNKEKIDRALSEKDFSDFSFLDENFLLKKIAYMIADIYISQEKIGNIDDIFVFEDNFFKKLNELKIKKYVNEIVDTKNISTTKKRVF